VPSLLRELGIDYEDRGDGELYARCPNPRHDDSNPSWHIHSARDSRNGVFHCWSCKWSGNVVKLVSAVKGCSMSDAAVFVERYSQKAAPLLTEPVSEDYERSLRSLEPPEIGYVWKGRRMRLYAVEEGTDASEYLHRRMVGRAYAERFGLQDWREKRRVVVPIRRRGRLISWIARSYIGAKPKTVAPKGAPKKWELFGYDEASNGRTASLCEGWVDAIRLMQAGRPNPIALCGSRVSEYQAESLAGFRKFEVWADGDHAGEGMIADLKAWFGRGREIIVYRVPVGKDPADLHPAEIVEIVKGGR